MQRQPPAAGDRKKRDVAMMRQRLPEDQARIVTCVKSRERRLNTSECTAHQQQPERQKLHVEQLRRSPFDDFRPRHLQIVVQPKMKTRPVRIQERGRRWRPRPSGQSGRPGHRPRRPFRQTASKPRRPDTPDKMHKPAKNPPCALVHTMNSGGASHSSFSRGNEYSSGWHFGCSCCAESDGQASPAAIATALPSLQSNTKAAPAAARS